MSEQITALFEQLRGSQPPVPFAPPDQVRRRGRQRTHRQALAAGSAVLAVAGLGTGWGLGTAGEPTPPPATSLPSAPPSPSPSVPSPSPSASPSHKPTLGPPSVPASALLTPEDFVAIGGVQASELDDQGRDGPEWPWETVTYGCPEYRAADYPSVAKRRGVRGLTYTADPWHAVEIVERYPDAAANLVDVRRVLAACPTFQVPDGVEVRQTVVAERFAGDDSLLVRLERGARIDYVVVVRVADLVATLTYFDGPEADARDMAAAMEARLR